MSQFDKPSSDGEPNKEIQDYLDLLLAPTADPQNVIAETQPSTTAAEIPVQAPPRETVEAKQPLSRQDVESTEPRRRSVDVIIPKPSKPSAPVGRSRLSQAALRIEQETQQKPFAEPVKPLTLKMQLAPVQAKPVEQAPAAKIEPPLEPVVEIVADKELEEEPIVTTEVDNNTPAELEPQQQAHDTTAWMENGRPSWAQERFECLLFSVGGLTLAVPLIELGSIYPITDELTPLFGQIDWFMGFLTVKGLNIRAVNTAKVVMPERYDRAMDDNFSYVLSINGVDWGLAVDNVANAITLKPEDVRWRSERSKRPWLAGTVVDHMCVLLDVSQLANMFLEQDKSKR